MRQLMFTVPLERSVLEEEEEEEEDLQYMHAGLGATQTRSDRCDR